MAHQHFDMAQHYEFGGRVKLLSIIGIVIGLAAVVYGYMVPIGHHGHERLYANLLLMSYYFACVCMSGAFFCALQFVAQAGWSAALLRVPQAIARTLPIAAVILIIVVATGLFSHNLYHHWYAEGITDPNSPHYDALIAKKAWYLNMPFFLGRIIVFLMVYSIFAVVISRLSVNEDLEGGLRSYKKSFKYSCIFLVIYGFTTPIYAFDTIMSIEAHWFSTMFGWYNFAAMWVSCLAVISVIVILLRKAGYMPFITDSHLHNLGQFVFGFSIFWTYVWFAQFLLYYYANIPEETVYFWNRLRYYPFWFYLSLLLNFVVPVLGLMDRDFKRNENILLTICILVLLGHWVDYYQMIMPGAVGPEFSGFGVLEIGIAIGFVGLFTFIVMTNLSKHALLPKNHPFLDESLHHHI